MIIPSSDSNNVCPVAHVTLTTRITASSNNCAVGFQPDRLRKSGSDTISLGNIIPERKTPPTGIAISACCAKRYGGMDLIALGKQGFCFVILNRRNNKLGCKEKYCNNSRSNRGANDKAPFPCLCLLLGEFAFFFLSLFSKLRAFFLAIFSLFRSVLVSAFADFCKNLLRFTAFLLGACRVRHFAGSYVVVLSPLGGFIVQAPSCHSLRFIKLCVIVLAYAGNIRLILRLRVRNGGIKKGLYFVLHSFYLLGGFGGDILFCSAKGTISG